MGRKLEERHVDLDIDSRLTVVYAGIADKLSCHAASKVTKIEPQPAVIRAFRFGEQLGEARCAQWT